MEIRHLAALASAALLGVACATAGVQTDAQVDDDWYLACSADPACSEPLPPPQIRPICDAGGCQSTWQPSVL